MAQDEQGERSEQASDTRREEFRKRGQVAHSKELGSAVILLVSAGAIYMLSNYFLSNFYELFQRNFGLDMVVQIREGKFVEALNFSALKAFILIMPVVCIGAFIGAASTIVQIGFLNVEEAMSPDFNKMNPVEGFGRIFSLRSLSEGVKSILKFIFIGSIVYMILKGEVPKFGSMLSYSVSELLTYIGYVCAKLLMGVGFVMLGLSLADYIFQRWDLEKKMMMTKQEVKEELKQREGDPMIKARIRRVQKEMANRRMMEAIPKADVVVTNPTHIAVVLKYDKNLPAPQLVAKGADLIAEKIKSIAREHNIPVIENKPLARTIFKTLKIGQVIPRELFVAVAEVLSYVYKLKRKVRA
ncbi:MAG: flagellar biosynthesis protein FlhB [Bdellovibrionota bacterium]